jgi:DNA repair protein RadC
MPIKDWPEGERPREKLLKQGAGSLSDAELLSIFVGSGTQGRSALDISRDAFIQHGSWNNLLSASPKAFCQTQGLGLTHYVKVQAAQEVGKRSLNEPMVVCDVLKNTPDVRRFVMARMKDYTREVFACLFLNSANHMVRFQELFYGTINAAAVYAREVVIAALHWGAVSVIIAHNHPSGVPTPSDADIHITQRLKKALETVDIRLLDHIIVGKGGASTSFFEQGLLAQNDTPVLRSVNAVTIA